MANRSVRLIVLHVIPFNPAWNAVVYIPPSFAENDLVKLHDHIERYSFATLVSTDGDEPFASHLPLLLDRFQTANGQLVGHMARANPQWKTAADRNVLVIFRGPHTYISPTWCDDQNVVPTWNYSVVHAYGTLRIVESKNRSADIVRQYVERYEADMSVPWLLDAVEDEFAEQLMKAIVSFTIDIDRLEGKWKLSQNHSEQRRANVVMGLRNRSWPGDEEVAELMSEG